ncbi:hypothetical protein V6N13_046708 [Hibiscus sabdariffa]|uniref:BHLH domain-containing protein n=1 Tax=Hibiscus sabdariffa TaxID=183260 RepID=A0ABR2P040_9ROSI
MELQMEHLVRNWGPSNKGTKRSRCSSGKVERKIIEKNRRNHMKNLYSMLNSLLPHHNSKELLTVPEQIDEAVDYIKRLQTKLKEFRERKEGLMGRKRSHNCSGRDRTGEAVAAEIRINETGPAMEVALTTGTDGCRFMFHEMIRILHDEGGEVVNANFCVVGNTVFHIVHAEISSSVAARTIKEKLNKLVTGTSGREEEVEQELSWDYEFDLETWNFSIM